MQDGSYGEGFLVYSRDIGSRKLVDDGLAIEPRSHYVVEGRSCKIVVGERDGSVYDWCIRNGNTCYDTGKMPEYGYHFGIEKLYKFKEVMNEIAFP